MAVPFVQATQNVQHQRVIMYDLAWVAKIIRHVLHALAVVRDGEIALLEEVKLSIELERASLTVPSEQIFNAKPGEPGRVGAHADRLNQVVVESAE